MCLSILERWCSWTTTYTSSACKLHVLLHAGFIKETFHFIFLFRSSRHVCTSFKCWILGFIVYSRWGPVSPKYLMAVLWRFTVLALGFYQRPEVQLIFILILYSTNWFSPYNVIKCNMFDLLPNRSASNPRCRGGHLHSQPQWTPWGHYGEGNILCLDLTHFLP